MTRTNRTLLHTLTPALKAIGELFEDGFAKLNSLGQNFIAWFTMSLCANCQVIFHARQRGAGIDLRTTPNATIRLIRAMKMTVLFLYMLLDLLEREIESGIRSIAALR